MLNVIGAILQIIFLIFKNKFEKDAKKKEEKDALSKEANEVIKSGDISKLSSLIVRMRK